MLVDINIPFKDFSDGNYTFEYTITDTFFEQFPESEIKQGHVNAKVDFIKKHNGFELTITIKGFVVVECDRCLDPYQQKIENTGKLYFEYGSVSEEVSDELIIISENENTIDIGQYINEFIHLALPMKRVHPDDENGNTTCNPAMIKKLSGLKANNKNEIKDPRWGKLNDLLN